MQYNTNKAGGVVYKVGEIFMVGKEGKQFPKREIWVEVPSIRSMSQKTDLFKIETIFEETAMLDDFPEGCWVDFIYTLRGRKFTNKKTGKEDVFNSIKLIDMKRGPNPFDKGEEIDNSIDGISSSITSSNPDGPKDWANEPLKQDTLFSKQEGDEFNDLPF